MASVEGWHNYSGTDLQMVLQLQRGLHSSTREAWGWLPCAVPPPWPPRSRPRAQTSASRAPQLVPPRVAVTRGLGIDALIRPARNWTLVSLATPQAHTREGPLPWEKSSHNNNRSSSTLPGFKPFYFPCISSVWGSSSIFPYFSHSSPFWLQSPNLQESTCCVS